MRRVGLIIAAATAFAAGSAITGAAQATPLGGPEAMRAAIGSVGAVQNVQLFWWHGRRYCWYDDGWHGPGWYWCGFAWREGAGWGGGRGWHGWSLRGHREFGRHEEFDRRGGREFEHRGERREFDRRGERREFDRRGEGREFERRGEGREFGRRGEGREFHERSGTTSRSGETRGNTTMSPGMGQAPTGGGGGGNAGPTNSGGGGHRGGGDHH